MSEVPIPVEPLSIPKKVRRWWKTHRPFRPLTEEEEAARAEHQNRVFGNTSGKPYQPYGGSGPRGGDTTP